MTIVVDPLGCTEVVGHARVEVVAVVAAAGDVDRSRLPVAVRQHGAQPARQVGLVGSLAVAEARNTANATRRFIEIGGWRRHGRDRVRTVVCGHAQALLIWPNSPIYRIDRAANQGEDGVISTEVVTMAEATKKWSRPQDWGELVVGVLVALSPLVVGASGVAVATLIVLGVLIAADGLWSLAAPGFVVSEGIQIVLGALLFISPWVLAFTGFAGASWVSWVGGVLTVIAGLVALPAANTAHKMAIPH